MTVNNFTFSSTRLFVYILLLFRKLVHSAIFAIWYQDDARNIKRGIRNENSKREISGIQNFHICPEVPVDIIRVFLIWYFLAESFKANKNLQNRSHVLKYSFPQKISLNLRTSTHLTLKIICSRNTTKNLSDFTNFQQTCLLHHFLTPKNCILEALWK